MTPHGADLTRIGSEPMEIKITIEDIEENELRTYGRLGKVFAHLLGEGAVSVTPSMEGEESTEAVEDQPSQPKKQKLPCAWCKRGFNTPLQLNKHLGFCSENPNNESTKETKTCTKCGATETPQWRRMAEHDGTLCNACAMKIRRQRTKPNAKQSNPFEATPDEKPARQRRIIHVKKPEKRPVFTKMDTSELRDAVASYVAGNNGVILEASSLASALMASLEKRYDFTSEKMKEHSESVLESSIGLQFRYLEAALKENNFKTVTFVLDSKRHTMMVLKSDGNFDVDDIREMLTQ